MMKIYICLVMNIQTALIISTNILGIETIKQVSKFKIAV